MKTRKLIQRLVAGVIGVTFAFGAFANDSMSHQRESNAPLGMLSQETLAVRIIKLDPESKYVNVYRDEIVTIVRGGKSFTWMFNTLGAPSFELAKIAPQGFDAGQVRVYVSFDPAKNSC